MAVGTLGVVGLGLIGGSLALALREARPELTILGCDRDPRTCRAAMDRGIVAVAGTDLDAVRAADLIVLAVPPLAMRKLLGELGGRLVTDVASTKAEVVHWAEAAGVDFVGGHPMCGAEASGLDAARSDLFQGATWVLSRPHPAVEDIVRSAGAVAVVIDAARHDRLVAGVSHSAFLLSVAYVQALTSDPEWPEMARLAAGGFRDMSRLAAGDPEMYAGIVSTNRQHIIDSLGELEAALARIRRHVEHDDPRLVELFEEARTARRRWESEHGRQHL
jgi:prephenate dehydrogenase